MPGSRGGWGPCIPNSSSAPRSRLVLLEGSSTTCDYRQHFNQQAAPHMRTSRAWSTEVTRAVRVLAKVQGPHHELPRQESAVWDKEPPRPILHNGVPALARKFNLLSVCKQLCSSSTTRRCTFQHGNICTLGGQKNKMTLTAGQPSHRRLQTRLSYSLPMVLSSSQPPCRPA